MASAHWRTGHTVNSLLAQKNGTGWNFLQLVRLRMLVLPNLVRHQTNLLRRQRLYCHHHRYQKIHRFLLIQLHQL